MEMKYTVTRKITDKDMADFKSAASGMKEMIRITGKDLLKKRDLIWIEKKLLYFMLWLCSCKYEIKVKNLKTRTKVKISFPLIEKENTPFVVETCKTVMEVMRMRLHIGSGPYSVKHPDGKKEIHTGDKGFLDPVKDKKFLESQLK